jgi:hypothetical protein
MAQETVRFVHDMVDERPDVDASGRFDRLKAALDGAFAKVSERLVLKVDPGTAHLADYGAPGGEPRGSLTGYVGPEVDWAIHSWLGSPHATFTNMHLTVWLGQHTLVPHLGIAFGTLPQPWCLLDYPSRVDATIDTDYLDRYYGPLNDQWLELREHPALAPFVSREIYVRQALTETAVCWSAAPSHESSPEVLGLLERLLVEHVDRWLGWLETGHPVPAEDRAALAERDLVLRRTIAERDPANIMGERLFGSALTTELIRALWGADRQLPRP